MSQNLQQAGLLERANSVGQFLVNSLEDSELAEADVHHLARVLRARDGERVITTDGAGSWRVCIWNGSVVVPNGEVQFEPRSRPEIAIGFSLLKGDKNEWVVQKLTEVGADVIVPVISAHSVVRWDEKKIERNHERFKRVAYEAAMQSRRVWLSDVQPISPLMNALDAGFALANPGGDLISLDQPRVIVGPEGGFSSEELDHARAVVDLGPTILRAETASITLCALLCARRAN